jgi:hypothetical protein
MGLFEKLTDKRKRSLASKYLHFHRADLLFIMDSRAVEGMRRVHAPRTRIDVPRQADPAYAKIVGAPLGLREASRPSSRRRSRLGSFIGCCRTAAGANL